LDWIGTRTETTKNKKRLRQQSQKTLVRTALPKAAQIQLTPHL